MSVEVSRQTYPFSLPELPYSYDALEPHIDQQTLQLHHREHHATCVKKLNEALAKEIAWHSTTPGDGREPRGMLADGIGAAFGSFAGFQEKFSRAATWGS